MSYNSMTFLHNYKVDDIVANFSPKDYSRGAEYARAGMVKNIRQNANGNLIAQVKGSRSVPYNVEIYITEDNNSKKNLSGYCSCPLTIGCKHIVATLLEGMKLISSVLDKDLGKGRIIDVTPKEILDQPNDKFGDKFNGFSSNPLVTPTENLAKNLVLDKELNTWLESFNESENKEKNPDQGKILIYIIESFNGKEAFTVSPVTTSILKNGMFGASRKEYRIDQVESYSRGKHVRDNDVIILRFISSFTSYSDRYNSRFKIPIGEEGLLLLKLLIDTGRCYLANESSPKNLLTMGEKRDGSIYWKVEANGTQCTDVRVDGVNFSIILATQPLHYICVSTKTVGILDIKLPSKQALALLKVPHVKPEQVEALKEKLISSLSITSEELLPATLPIRDVLLLPTPVLKLRDVTIQQQKLSGWSTKLIGQPLSIPVAILSFEYMGRKFSYHDSELKFSKFKNGEVQVISRNLIMEKEIMNNLQYNHGFIVKLNDINEYYNIRKEYAFHMTLGKPQNNFHKDKKLFNEWENFMQYGIPKLKEAGWKIEIEPNFSHNIIKADDEWYATVEETSGIDWFGVELGVTIADERINLVPILLNLLKKTEDIFETIAKLSSQQTLLIPLKDGRRLSISSERAKILLGTIQHIFSFQNNIDEKGKLKMQALDAALLAEIEEAARSLNIRWFGGDKLRKLGKHLKNFDTITEVPSPKNFHGQLRGYQHEGLNWLQFLREYNLAGILADDMGLGKTIQVLAHIATEISTKLLDRPFLVIVPTSLIVNWKMEAAQFVPDLKVLTLHGSERKAYFNDIKKYDLILTTYPLVLRDKDMLLAHEYHTLILDEAQVIKNSSAKVTQVVNQIKANYRLCMTGTPLENHLGELWSLFNFLLPGYLGNKQQFTSIFRNPIEKCNNLQQGEALMRRIKPFILRRTKQQVVKELPPKTEIVRMVELEGSQRDLYETIRVSMHEKIRAEIATHGMEKSHIIVLDALLKLRQVCCDPSLLKIESAKNVVESAKRDELMNMLTTMIDEGRKILLFSQFTSMLQLIERELEKLGIAYVKLTGQTKDRQIPICSFQEGKVPLFLISLKAGGIGLNLTAADTIIHFDPWWNPAVEDQATDRAYRIGQDKPVFVYKIITIGTVEEKIIEMQKKKRQLIDSIFDPAASASIKLTAGDIQTLFEPLDTKSPSVTK